MKKQQPQLGKYLKSLREANRFTLRAVERETGISNGMLSQLESGKVKQTSPIFLYKLAELYDVPYEELMKKAGYPVPKTDSTRTEDASGPLHRFGTLTSEEEEALFEYLTFIRTRSNRGRGRP